MFIYRILWQSKFHFIELWLGYTNTMTALHDKNKTPLYAYVIVICVCMTVFVGDYSAYQLPPLSHFIIPQLDITDAEFSRLFAAAMIPGVLFCLISGLLCDKFGTKLTIGVGLAISAIGIIGRVFIIDYNSIYASLFLIGITATFTSANIPKIIVNWVPPQKVGLFVGICISGGPVAMTVAMATTALFPSVKSAFILSAIICALVLVLWFTFMKEKPKGLGHASQTKAIKEVPLLEGLRIVIRNKYIWMVGLSSGFMLSAAISASTFLPRALQIEKELDAVASGALTSSIMIGNIIGSIVGPIICMKVGKMRPILFAGCMIMALGVAFSWNYASGVVLSVCLILTGVAGASVLSLLTSSVVLFRGIGPRIAGTAGGFACTIRMILCSTIPPYVIAPIANGDFTILFIIAGLMAVIAGFISLRILDVYSKKF